MCDPVIGLTIAATLVTATGQIAAGNASAAASRYNAQIAEMNAKIADNKALDALERGKIEEQKKRADTAKIMGAQQAAMAANGVDLSFGSPLDTIAGTAALGELDALTIRSNAYREEYDYRVQGANQRAQANLNRMQASSAKTGSLLSAGATVLTSAANIAKYSKGG